MANENENHTLPSLTLLSPAYLTYLHINKASVVQAIPDFSC